MPKAKVDKEVKGSIDEHDDEIIQVVEDVPEKEEVPVEENPTETDEHLVTDEGDDEGDDDGDEGEDIEGRRARRKVERADRKKRQEEARKRDRLEMDFLRTRNEDLERRLSAQEVRAHQVDVSSIDAAITAAERDKQQINTIIGNASVAKDAAAVSEALAYRDKIEEHINNLKYKKYEVSQRPPVSAPAIDPSIQKNAQDFVSRHPWYDVNGRTTESQIVLAIDQGLEREGYDPKTPEYWEELENRVKRRLPEKFTDTVKREAKGGPAVGGKEQSNSPSSGKKTFKISAERKQALMDMGVWDDPVLRNKYIKRYMEYDNAAKNS